MEAVLAIEDHPQFDAWCEALDELKAAKDNLRVASVLGEIGGMVESARARLAAAQTNYNQMTDDIYA